VTRSKKLELKNAVMKPFTVAIIGALVVAVAVFGYLYYQRTRNDITIQTHDPLYRESMKSEPSIIIGIFAFKVAARAILNSSSLATLLIKH
jgi:hypothetical protein